MDEERPIHEVLLNLAVYAPVGLAIVAVEEFPRLTEKGRERIAGQIKMAHVVGKFAVREAERRVGRMFGTGNGSSSGQRAESDDRAGSHDRASAGVPRQTASRNGRTGHKGLNRVDIAASEAAEAAALASDEAVPAGPTVAGPPPQASTLAIPGYDTLAASQVVQRLSSLRRDELEAIRVYEAATRGRRTILHRISQLAPNDTQAGT